MSTLTLIDDSVVVSKKSFGRIPLKTRDRAIRYKSDHTQTQHTTGFPLLSLSQTNFPKKKAKEKAFARFAKPLRSLREIFLPSKSIENAFAPFAKPLRSLRETFLPSKSIENAFARFAKPLRSLRETFLPLREKKSFLLTILFSFAGINSVQAQTSNDLKLYILLGFTFIIAFVTLLTALVALWTVKVLLNKAHPPVVKIKPAFSVWDWFVEKFISGKLVPIGQEATIALDHNYDGIVELDNRMPPWLRYLFIGTILFAIFYFSYYSLLQSSPGQIQEYEYELAEAEKQTVKRKLLAANSIDEFTVKFDSTAFALESGKTIYINNCKACHGDAGQGGVGPNLADNYWLHGEKINDVFKTIKYGVPQKGMIAWQSILKPIEIQNLSSFIQQMKGSNPAGGKEPQGIEVVAEKKVSLNN